MTQYGAPYVANLVGTLIAELYQASPIDEILSVDFNGFNNPDPWILLDLRAQPAKEYILRFPIPRPNLPSISGLKGMRDWSGAVVAFIYLLLGIEPTEEQSRGRSWFQFFTWKKPERLRSQEIGGATEITFDGFSNSPAQIAAVLIQQAIYARGVAFANINGRNVMARWGDPVEGVERDVREALGQSVGYKIPFILYIAPGTSIRKAASEMIDSARIRRTQVIALFNDILLTAMPDSELVEIIRQYDAARRGVSSSSILVLPQEPEPESESTCPYMIQGRKIDI